jgi:hypothetical protein
VVDDADVSVRLADAWRGFCRDLEELGELVQREGTPRTEYDQAEGYRFLCRLLRNGLGAFESTAQPGVAFREKDPNLHIGFTSPDQDPLTCAVDPSRDYRITGTRGTNAGLGILSMAPATMQHVGWLNHDDLTIEDDGTFEIMVSQRPHPGNWLQLSEDSSLLVIRCNFNDRANETRAQFTIEEIDAPPALTRQPLTADGVIAALRAALMGATVMAGRMVEWSEELVTRPNQIGVLESYSRSGGSPDHDFRFGYFEIPEGHALEFKFVPPECDNWQFQIGNWWVENLDNYVDDQGWVNKKRANLNEDGSVTLVASPDPQSARNWVDSFGRSSGVMGLRFVCATSSPPVTVRLIRAADA